MLSGCSGLFFAQREAWRHEAEVQCVDAGLVREGPGIVQLSAIQGPSACGIDFPFKVSAFGESAPIAFVDDPRPPGTIPSGSPSWPIKSRDSSAVSDVRPYSVRPSRYDAAPIDPPVSLTPRPAIETSPTVPDRYDFRKPYGGAAPAPAANNQGARPSNALRDDFSPEPYERRRLVQPEGAKRESSAATRAPLREPVQLDDWTREHARGLEAPPGRPVEPARHAPAVPVAVNPPATLACPVISELDRWIAGAVQPAAMRWFGSPVAEIKQISAYSCRGMNGNSRAPISEHAFGNALDIAAFTLADGRTITVKNGWRGLPEEQGFLRDVQAAACDQFSTVLAPGSNVYHYDHIHVDLMRRSSARSICQPAAVSGELVAARAGHRFARSDPAVTGSIKRTQRTFHRPVGRDEVYDGLPRAVAGED
jgi:hypothetical protein